ncbi:DNA mismatch repair endonuclease MutL [Effusibacillus lacus]|uniref:DNA mismatch repair protein MutL n=1 Tax=Effusibacillus lacus TaxID=1348429 RepID=A0A292YTH7_9BACL|nr:DNA mismatch repair endonuclease MutL [Effusibacillus lacus]TCS75822.1 DNA mismatch repair protein MutL [Effusibacillus lacus]GAX91785.1 DNA mismatch repair protein MutL [Effusibacillus lacus]
MAKIRVMDDLLANKIAAGEVVERPASVVKELVENALDAGATEIEIELVQGGLELIRVADNGSGIDSEDVPVAFERHATSKIMEDKDLFKISTLGFRGEALPSIAAVSRVEMKTRTENETAGSFIRIEGGRIQEIGVTAANKGTDIFVRDLFFNTPARLKYLKSIQTELGHATDYIERMALARPDVAFRLTHNSRILVQTAGDGKLPHAVTAVYGRETVKQMVDVEWENYDYRITGLAGYPELNRANRNHCTFLVNGRYVKSFQLFNAVQAAYHTRLPIHRYPVCVLHLQLDPTLVDVNVHPTKLEVRFSEEKDVYAAVQSAVQSALERSTFIPKALPRTPQTFSSGNEPAVKSTQSELKLDNPGRIRYSEQESATDSSNHRIPKHPVERIRETKPDFSKPVERIPVEAAMDLYRPDDKESVPDREQEPVYDSEPQVEHPIPRFRPIAQALGMYVIAESEEGLFIIDQHAAHEKVLFEKFSKRLQEKKIRPLPLLVPLTLELSPSEGQKLEKQLQMLAEYHMEVEQFGGGSFLVRSVPDIWSGLDIQRLASEFMDEFLAEGSLKDPRSLIEDKLITKACKSAIKANQWLSMPEMTALCDQLSELENPFTCPHGRPIIIHMTTYDLEKQFKRVM